MPFSPIAKSKDGGVLQSFEGHTLDALNIFGDYVNKNRLVLNDFASNFQIEYDILMNLIFLSVYLHDLGKLTREFQKRIVVGEQSGYFSHAFFGLPCVNSDLPAELNSMLKLLVLSHHTQLYNNIYEGAKLANNVNYLNEYIKYWIESSKDIYINYFSSLFDMLFYPSYMLDDYFHDTDLNEAIKEEVWQLKYKQSKNSDKRTKALYSLCISILKHCDQKSSKCFQERNLSEGTYGSLLNKSHEFLNYANYDRLEVFNISKDLIVKFPEKDKPAVLYPFQERLSALDRSCIISAPCGRGKTEGALLCALNILKRRNKNKIIFALPTQITSNAMYERLKRIFGINNVGLYHGMSRYHHYEENDLKEEDIRNIVYDEKVFEKAITITTIDHLIYSLIHGYKQADFALGNILNSVVIFDEIHYYEPHTLRYVMDCLRIFKDLNIPYITMSGTLPNFIINELNKIQAHEFVEDVEGMKFSPFIIRKESKSIFEAIDEIESIYNDRKNQIIILNTIPRAKQMYNLFKDKIPKEELCLLHSQFTFSDRREKEKMILGGLL